MVAMARTASMVVKATGDARADACAADEPARSTGGSSSASAAISDGADGFALRAERTMKWSDEAVGRADYVPPGIVFPLAKFFVFFPGCAQSAVDVRPLVR